MTRKQLVRYEMLSRVRSFGVVNRDTFPEESAGGLALRRVAEAVEVIDEYLARRTKARAEARQVRAATRSAVSRYMKAIAATGRRATAGEWGAHPFRLPSRKSAPVILSTARMFMAEAERRKDGFVALGMAPTFLADFGRLIGELEQAVGLQHNSRGLRREAQAGIESTLDRGFSAIHDLDVIIPNVLGDDAAKIGQWEGARHIDSAGATGDRARPVVAPTALVEAPKPTPAMVTGLEKAV